jgi:hypothetical protein
MAPPMSQPLLQPSCSRTYTTHSPSIHIAKASAASSAFCPYTGHIKVGNRFWAANRMSTSSSNVAAGRTLHFGAASLTRARPVLQQFLACPFRPSSRIVIKLARLGRRAVKAVASDEEEAEGQPSANCFGAASQQLFGRSQTFDIKPGWPADDVQPGRQVKTCTKCQYPKLVVDFQESITTVDKRQDVCRACMATISAMWHGKELHHLSLSPAEAWSRAKTCVSCKVVKEIREFAHDRGAKDGTARWCRSCRSMYDKARAANMPVDSPQRCNRCDELKPARAFTPSPKTASGLFSTCKACQRDWRIERRARLKEHPVKLPERQAKVCSACGKLKSVSQFHKDACRRDGLYWRCKSCSSAHHRKAYREWKKRGAFEAPPPAEATLQSSEEAP